MNIDSATSMRLSEVMSALSFALDITEGQPEGHAVRTCMLGMRIGAELGLSTPDRAALFYALLLKDLGCSSNAAKVSSLFRADDHALKRELKTVDWTRPAQMALYSARHAGAGLSAARRISHLISLGLARPGAGREMYEIRCDRGAEIAGMLGFPAATAEAIRTLDEHWDGRGQPAGLHGEEIPLLGRIAGLAQTVEVFCNTWGRDDACEMARKRRGEWFDPALVDVLELLRGDREFWVSLAEPDPRSRLGPVEPQDQVELADDERLDTIAAAFAQVIDAKSPWTFRHSERVAGTAVGIARLLDTDDLGEQTVRRAGLLHDIGKLGVSNLVLDKPGALTDAEWEQVRRHPEYTQRILERVAVFQHLADDAAAHHERPDGRGYHRGIGGDALRRLPRVLAVADQFDALTAERPYRKGMEPGDALAVLRGSAGTGVCPACVDALAALLESGHD